MDEIFVAVVKVSGTSETINRAMQMASDVIAGKSAPAAVEIPHGPVAALPAAAPVRQVAGKFYCKYCPETFDSVGKVSAHTRMKHPKKPKAETVSAVKAPLPETPKTGAEAGGRFWCGQKNCSASFSKEGWRKQHWERAHGIKL